MSSAESESAKIDRLIHMVQALTDTVERISAGQRNNDADIVELKARMVVCERELEAMKAKIANPLTMSDAQLSMDAALKQLESLMTRIDAATAKQADNEAELVVQNVKIDSTKRNVTRLAERGLFVLLLVILNFALNYVHQQQTKPTIVQEFQK